MRVAVGLVTFNRASLLQTAVEKMMQQTRPVDQIFIVDNGSTDGTKNTCKVLIQKYPGKITTIHHESNEGSAGGFNKAARSAYEYGADWIWLIDDDAHPEPQALEKLLNSEPARQPTTGGLGSLVINEEGQIHPNNLQCRVDRNDFTFHPVVNLSRNEIPVGPVAIDSNSFDGFLVHRRAIETCGVPDSSYFLWYDDIEFSLRISKKLKLWLIPESRVLHLGEARSEERAHFFFPSKVQVYEWPVFWRMYYRSRNYFFVLRANSSIIEFHKKFLKQFLKDIMIPFVFMQDHPFERLRIAVKAATDGYLRRGGKQVNLNPPFI